MNSPNSLKILVSKRMIIYWSRLSEHRHFMFLYLNHVFLRTPSSLMLLLMIPLLFWRTNSGKIFTGKVLKVVRQLCMLEIGIGMLRWRDGPTEVPSMMVSLSWFTIFR
ncbi:hypothetical protein HanPI659440_Chr05g0192621 [Helianthus annuus]|nr:hypothetical protein HanPI659440_Chr05g0192621 [Helianthus annuus]